MTIDSDKSLGRRPGSIGNEMRPAGLGRVVVWVIVAASPPVFLVLVWLLSRLELAPLDFHHYYQASRMIWQAQNPYGVIEFFAPPWLALVLAPLLPLSIYQASAAWILICLVSIAAATILSQQWLNLPRPGWARLGGLVLAVVTPAALFVYITGQLSAVVVLAALVAAVELQRRAPRPWLLAVALATAAFKPNIIWLPVLLVGLQVVRQRDWRAVTLGCGVFALLALFSFARLPDWPGGLLAAWGGGAYRGGAGLVAAGYIGLPELGVPNWIFGPLLAYVFWRWWREGLSVRVVALAFAICLLVAPYSRSYDDVILVFPSIACLGAPGGARRWFSLALVIAAWVIPMVRLAVLAPVLITAAVLLAVPAIRLAPMRAGAPIHEVTA